MTEGLNNEVIVDATIKARSEPIFNDVCEVLSKRGYVVRVGKLPGKPKKIYRKTFASVSRVDEVLNDRTKLLVIWWARSGGWLWGIPRVVLFRGILPKTWLLDTGLLSKSILVDKMPGALDPFFSDECQQWSSKYCRYMVKSNQSMRPQPPASKIRIPKNSVFLPLQYSKDMSIKEHCSVSYDSFVTQVSKFCVSHDLHLIVKNHPDVQRGTNWRAKELNRIGLLLNECRKRGCQISVMNGSIHSFLKRCRFMVGMNTLSHIDAMFNGCVSFHCGGSPFMNSGAVVHDEDIPRGLDRCLRMSVEDSDQFLRHQKALLYYLYHRYSLFTSNMNFVSDYSNAEKIVHIFDYIDEV